MPKFSEILERRNSYGDRLSNQVRVVSIGVLATSWSLVIGKVKILNIPVEAFNKYIIVAGTAALLSLFFDFLQYFFSYLNTQLLLLKMASQKQDESDYRYDFFYNLSYFFFWAKQFVLSVGVILFVFCMFKLISDS